MRKVACALAAVVAFGAPGFGGWLWRRRGESLAGKTVTLIIGFGAGRRL